MTQNLAPAARRIVGLDALTCLAAAVLGVAGGLLLIGLGEMLLAGSISAATWGFYPVVFIIVVFPALLSAGAAVLAVQLLRRFSGTEKTVRFEPLLGAAVVALGMSLGIFSWGGMASVLGMLATSLPVAVLTWLGLRKSGAIAARRAARGVS
ncbi:hypothetical protein [Nesterenkonia jeotgali]|uniref:Uncharacterized protein n=1 Tax=Nesterenkonia jeotgali TaxID=317018 RepID=A0A839FTI7_9MICC|nr:hypothetical protein [Nesterenkonia jeotgali]MBA8922695.1 hypothetical protein [Nesterenkonia jeotgali]